MSNVKRRASPAVSPTRAGGAPGEREPLITARGAARRIVADSLVMLLLSPRLIAAAFIFAGAAAAGLWWLHLPLWIALILALVITVVVAAFSLLLG